MPRRAAIGKIPATEIILIGMYNERPTPEITWPHIRQIVFIVPPLFNIAEIAAVSLCTAWSAMLNCPTPHMQMIARPRTTLSAEITRTMHMESM